MVSISLSQLASSLVKKCLYMSRLTFQPEAYSTIDTVTELQKIAMTRLEAKEITQKVLPNITLAIKAPPVEGQKRIVRDSPDS